MFQAKQTAKYGAKAVQHLKQELKGRKGKPGDLEKASKAKVDHLVVLTSAMVQEKHKATLKKLRDAERHPFSFESWLEQILSHSSESVAGEPPLVGALEPRDGSDLGEALRDDRRYLLVVDDAESLLEERLITAVRAVHENPGRRSVIGAIRSSATHHVQQAFRKAQFPEPEFIEVPQMGEDDQLRLIEEPLLQGT